MEDKYIAAIDLGTSRIVLAVAKIEAGNVKLIYGRETPSEGIRYSHVSNPSKVGEAVGRAVSLAEEELGIKVGQVVVGKPRYEVVLKDGCYGVKRDGNKCITADDLRDFRKLAMAEYSAGEGEALFDAVAQSFNCEDGFQTVEKEVIGMTAEQLEANFKLFVGKSKYVNDLELAFSRAGGIPVVRQYFTPVTTAKAVLYDNEMENGVALIESGAGITSVSIFIDGVLRHYAAIPFGGRTVTMDIKTICAIPEQLAENIKKAYGACMPDNLQNLGDKTLMVETDKALPQMQLPVQYLSEVITARETEIVNAILYEIQESGFADKIRGVVLTGGGAEMRNISALVKELSGYNVRLGYPRYEAFTTSVDLGLGGAAVVGMLLTAVEEERLGILSDGAASGKEEVETDSGESVFDEPKPQPQEDGKKKKKDKKEKKPKEEKPKTEEPKEEEKPDGGSEGGGWKFMEDIFGGLFNDNEV